MNTIPITYIGHRATYRDGACGSGAVFEQGQTLHIQAEFAHRMLKHPGVYVRADVEQSKTAKVVVPIDTSEKDKQNEVFNREQDMRDAFNRMDKEALATFAQTHWRVELDKRMSVERMRAAVVQNFDQYGVAA
jgi:hypothetical protein